MKKLYIVPILIFVVFFSLGISIYINSIKKNNLSEKDYLERLFFLETYCLEATVNIKSNKNENTYTIKQIVDRRNQKYKMVFDDVIVMHVNNTLHVKSDKQKNEYSIENYELNLSNTLFLEDIIDCSRDEINRLETIDDKNVVKILIELKGGNKFTRYKELEIDKVTKNPIKLSVLDENKKVYMDIIYNRFDSNINIEQEFKLD